MGRTNLLFSWINFNIFSLLINVFIVILIASHFSAISEAHICNHIYPRDDEVIRGVYLEETVNRRSKRDSSHPLRIRLVYDESVYRLTSEEFNIISEDIFPEAVNYWEKALQVRHSANRIRLNRRCAANQVFLLKDDPRPYCREACEATTLCGEVRVPEDHLNECLVCDALGHGCGPIKSGNGGGEGILDADFVLYVSAIETNRCSAHGSTVAYAAHCQQEGRLDRPIAGHANLCPAALSAGLANGSKGAGGRSALLATVQHEMAHALGFSVSLYAFFRDENGEPLTPRDQDGKPPLNAELGARQWSDRVVRVIERENWTVGGVDGGTIRKANMVVTPSVVREVRAHFNCSDLEGAELEDQGGEGTSLTHWEKRVFENEAMTGTHTQRPVYSRVTLALLEDTGWYSADYSQAEELWWGRGLGCEFASESCNRWIASRRAKKRDLRPFCDQPKEDPLRTSCAHDGSAVALCNLVRYPTPLPPHYQNFADLPGVPSNETAFYGGSVMLADFCPFLQEFTWRGDAARGSQCTLKVNSPLPKDNFALERYAEGSRCLFHDGPWGERACRLNRAWRHWGSGCYETRCVNDTTEGLERVAVIVANRTYVCFKENQVIKIHLWEGKWLHEGSVVCPACSQLCSNCLPDRSLPARLRYPYDALRCGASSADKSGKIVVILLLFLHMARK